MKKLTIIFLGVLGAVIALPLMKLLIFPVQLGSLYFKPENDPAQDPTFMTMLSLGILLAKILAAALAGYAVWRCSGRKPPTVAIMGLILGGLGAAVLVRRLGHEPLTDGYRVMGLVSDAVFISLVLAAAMVIIFKGRKSAKKPNE